jgi:anthranilate synthase/aminodeoxychorismate synthase-like glutamine amidotransferase
VRLLMIDNYDSFTYNLVQYLGELGAEIEVVRNDAAPVEDLLKREVNGVVISPGPGRPEAAGVSVAAVEAFAGLGTPVLGVCLGHQAIGEAFGGRIAQARTIMHGKTSPIHHDQSGVFEGLPTPLDATRYHSLVVDPDSCPQSLEVSARSPDGEIMGLRHRELPIDGVQFHPESILTPEGKRLLANFLSRCGGERSA